MNSTNVLISGITGFIGSSLKYHIKSKYPHWRVYGINREVKDSKLNFRFDLGDGYKLNEILSRLKPRYIFHMCGDTQSKDFKRLLIANVYTTFVLLDAIKKIKSYNPRIIIPSSAAEQLMPVSSYGFSKILQTELSLIFAKQGLDIVIARIFNISGRAVPKDFCLGKFAYELALIRKGKKSPIIHTKNLDSRRDFLDIHDICLCLLRLAIYGKSGKIYNVCRGKTYKIRYLLKKLIGICGIKKDIRIIEDKENGKENNAACVGSRRKIAQIIKTSAPVPIETSLKDAYSYYLSEV